MSSDANLNNVTLEQIVSLCKRRGFVYQSAEIYSGLNGVYDFGPLGTQLKQNIKNAWTKALNTGEQDVVFMDGAILGAQAVWQASGHADNFSDPLVDCQNCKKRFRADDINLEKPCPSCGIKKWTDIRQFKLMFETNLGAVSDNANIAYLRPETAQSIFINFKNVMSSTKVKIPFGIAQIGKAFRNEITPKQFLFRMREFEQMEMEFFCQEKDANNFFETWVEKRLNFYKKIGLDMSKIRTRVHEKDELAHYSKNCTDVEYNFPFGWKELEGIAYRGNFDLSQHSKFSGKDLSVFDDETKESYMPHVVECSVGVDRLFLTILFDAYTQDTVEGETRVSLRLHPSIAPVTAAILPLSKNLSENSIKIYENLKQKNFKVQHDESGSIGKRYRRQDEIGTPVCITYDFDSLNDNQVTIRDRDSLKQERISIDQIENYLNNILNK
ncbi:MAG: Glycine-tRNA ligase [candidate division TM6 bacterium GW2011_GWF2_28_16]|nr:MAG: Glycine-tRNA ligase [candidate division TM6 bacterium GW2011_GWF2_28_16]